MLRKISVAAVLVLALGIGANTAIFSVVREVLLKPLGFRDGDRLVTLWSKDTRMTEGTMPVTPADYRDWRERLKSVGEMAASSDGVYNLTGSGEPEMLIGYQFAPEMFSVLGVMPALGRVFTAEDGDRVVILSHDLWQRRFGGDPSMVGKAIQLNGKSVTVVGVMPPDFTYPKRTALWAPLVIEPAAASSREQRFLRIVGRLAPGASLAQARAELDGVAGALASGYPETNRTVASQIMTMRELMSGDIRTPLLVLSGAVGFLLLLACANVAALLVARAARRQRELAIRVALGATRGRLIRQLLGETLVVAALGGVLAMLLASWSTDALVGLFPKRLGNVSIPSVSHIPVDGVVLAFSLLVSAVCAFLCGLPAAISATGGDVERTLREGVFGDPPRATRLRRWLVGGELALATVITVGAALLVRSSWNLAGTSLGFDGEGVVTARLFLSDSRYPSPEKQRQVVADIMERLRARPEVASAGAISTLPLSGWWSHASFTVEGRPVQPGEALESGFLVTEPGYFATMRIPLLQGRLFGREDMAATTPVIVIDDRLARRVFPAGDALGKRLNTGTVAEPEWRTIVGIVGEVHESGPAKEVRPEIYVSYAQQAWPLVGLVARARNGDAAGLAKVVRAAVWEVDPDQPLSYVMTAEELRADVMATARVIAWLFTFFAATALALGALGVYGVTSTLVARRTREIGVRMALGARRIDVLRWVLMQTMPVAAAGLLVGLALALALSRVLASQLHGVTPTDPTAMLAVGGLLVLAALVATGLPARRAMRIDPAEALRSD